MNTRVKAVRGCDYQLKPCNFDKWVKYDSLPIEQACFVLLGFEPIPLEVTNTKPIPYLERRLPSWERPQGFDDALAILKSSIENGNVQTEPSIVGQCFTRKIQWPALISWAKSKRFTIPPELEARIELPTESLQSHNHAALAPEVTVAPARDHLTLPTKETDRGWVLKKAALIQKHQRQWPTINRDFQDSSENELSKAAKAPGHGNWFEADALNWARQRGKLSEKTAQQAQTPATPFSGLMRE